MLKDFLVKLFGEGESYYISSILENDKAYCIYLTDIYGNDIDELPICVYKSTYTRCDDKDALDVELSDTKCEIPEECLSNRGKVKKLIIEEYKKKGVPEEDLIGVVLSEIFNNRHIEYSLSELYQITRYLLEMVMIYCSEEERKDFLSMNENEAVKAFFSLSDEEKLNRSKIYYYKPKSVEKLLKISDEILGMAINKYKGVSTNEELIENAYKEFRTLLIETIKEIIDGENDLIKKEILLPELLDLKKQVSIEHDFIMDIKSDISERLSKCFAESSPKFLLDFDGSKFGKADSFTDLK